MKDISKECIEHLVRLKDVPTLHALEFCLQELFHDKKRSLLSYAAGGMTYEYLIGALLQARDYVEMAEQEGH